jgi:hypothetical protein
MVPNYVRSLFLGFTGLLLAACAAPSAAPVAFTATDGAFSGPAELPSGWTEITLTNNGQEPHHLQLVRLDAGRSVEELGATLSESGGAFPSWGRPFGGPNAPDPGGTTAAVVNLEPGSYALIDVIPDAEGVPHMAKGMVSTLTVTDEESGMEEPAADITIELNDYSFTLTGSLTAGDHAIRIKNLGTQVHEAVLVRLEPGKTAQDVLNAPPGSPPPAASLGGITGIEPGATQYVPVTLESGSYALFCFFPDPATQTPHFLLGMIGEFDVP